MGSKKQGESPEWSGGLNSQEFEQGRRARWIGAGLKSMKALRPGRVQPKECRGQGTKYADGSAVWWGR